MYCCSDLNLIKFLARLSKVDDNQNVLGIYICEDHLPACTGATEEVKMFCYEQSDLILTRGATSVTRLCDVHVLSAGVAASDLLQAPSISDTLGE